MALERINFGDNAAGFDLIAFERMKAETENKRPKPDDGLNVPCTACGGGGYLLDVLDDGSRFTKPCACYPLRQARLRLRNAGLLERAERDTFQSFQATEPYQRDMKEKAADFCKSEKKGWLMLCGQPGCGKTHLCVAVVGQLAKQGYSVHVMPWVNIVRQLKDFNDDSRGEAFQKCVDARVLYIDDFLKGTPGKTEYESAFVLLNDRYNDPGKITIISSERTPEELGQFDQAIRGRIIERCGKHLSVVGKAPGRDYRLKGEK